MSFIYGEELHPPYYNFMGPSSKIEDRISLNYKRKGQGPLGIKKGTLSFWIPSSKSDLVSFEHDLMYYSPNNYIKALADFDYLKNVESDIGLAGIGLQFIRRFGLESIPAIIKAEAIRKAFMKTLNEVIRVSGEVKTERKQYRQAGEELLEPLVEANNIWNELTGRNNIFEGITEARRLFGRDRVMAISKIILKSAPYLIAYGIIGKNTIEGKVKDLYRQMSDYVYQTNEYKKMNPYIEDIMEKLNKYLNEVGEFKELKDLPLSKKILYGMGATIDRPFVVKDVENIDREKARKLYIEYFEAFEKYAKFMNDRHEGDPDYEKFNFKPLNMERLPLVSAPSGLTPENLNDIILFNQTIGDPVIDPNEKMEKIEAILAGKSMPEDRPKEEISTEDKPFGYDIPDVDDEEFINHLREEQNKLTELLKDEL